MDQTNDRARAAARMRFAIACDALGGFDSHDDGVALGRRADSHDHGLALVETKGKRKGSDGGDLQRCPRFVNVCISLAQAIEFAAA